MLRVLMIALVTLVILIATPAFAVVVTLNPNPVSTSFIKSTAYDGTTYDQPTCFPALPDSGTVFADGGSSSAETGYILTNEGFELIFEHSRTAAQNAVAESYGSLYFSVDTNIDYVLKGSYTAIDETGRRTWLEVKLLDDTITDTLFLNLQVSETTPNESFTLGLEEGDTTNSLVGSLTGTLVPDHEYRLYFRTIIWKTATGPASVATATGSVSLTFVPESLCVVDFEHFTRFAEYWLASGPGLPADLYEDENDIVDLLDLMEFVGEWLNECPSDWPLK